MKNEVSRYLLYVVAALPFLCPTGVWAQANDIKANTSSMAAATANWLNADGGTGIVPATADTGEFDATISAGNASNLTLGGVTLVLAGLQFDATMNGPVTIGTSATLALGTVGINMSAANQNVTINAPYRSGTVETWNVATNEVLTLNGAVLLDQSSSSANQDPLFPSSSGTQVLTITGSGTINVPNATLIPNYTGSGTGIASASGVLITGGTFNGAGITIQRSANLGTAYPTIGSPFVPATTAGFVVNGASTVVNLGTLSIGGGFGNNPAAANIVNGVTTVTNAVFVGGAAGNSNPQRWGGFEIQGGSFTSLDTNTGFVIAQSNGGVLNPEEVYFAGGVATINKILIGSPLDPVNSTNRTSFFLKGGTLYVGSQGIAVGNSSPNNVPYNGINGYVISLYSGILGAAANWSSSLAMTLSGTTPAVTIQTADALGNPHNITLSGIIGDGGSVAPLAVTGGGVLTLSGANTNTGSISLNGGIINAGSAEIPGVSGPFGLQADTTASEGTILFGGGTLQFSPANQFDYSVRFDNGTLGDQPISVDTAGQNVTFASALAGTGTSLTVNDSVGTGSLTIKGANTYDTGTFVNSGTLNVDNTSGSGTGSGNVTVGGTGTLGGSGTIAGSVVVNSGGTTLPGLGGLTTTIGGNLTYHPGANTVFDLAASTAGPGNDEIVLSGAGSTLNCGNVVTINVTGAGLDASHNYMLFNVPNGSISGSFNSVPNFTGTPLLHPNFYSVQQVGSQIQLVVTSVTPPTIGSQSAVPSSIQANQSVTISATVTPGQYPISSVVVNLSELGLSSTQALANTSGNTWSVTVTAAASALPGNDTLGITATDNHNTSTTVTVPLTVLAAPGNSQTWNGADHASSLNWTDAANWQNGLAPGFGNNLYFGGSVTDPYMNGSYLLSGVNFNAGAGSFNLTGSGTLSLSGGATNNSSVQQTITVPVTLSGTAVTVNDANGAGVVLGGAVSGPSLNSLTTAGNVTLGAANTFAGSTLAASGTLTLNNTLALQSSTLNNSGGTVSFGSLASASIGALTGTKNLSLVNATPAPVALTIGGNNSSQSFSGSLTDTGNGGSLTITGTGTQTLTGVNTYKGGTTNGAGSTLVIGGAGQLGSGSYAASMLNNGSLNYNSSASQTLSGPISGSGPLNDTGSGTLTLSGADTYSGNISIGTGSKLTIGGAGQLGGGGYAASILNNGTLTYNSTASQTLSGTLSGTGALSDTGTGTLVLGAANPGFTGATSTGNGATLQINNSSALASSVLTYSTGNLTFGNAVSLVTLGGLSGTSNSVNLALVDAGNPVTLSVVNGVAHSFAGAITDGGLGGSLLVGGAGQTLTGTNTYQGGTTVLSGSLTVGGAGKLGGGNYTGVLSPQTGATFIWNSSVAQTLGGLGFEGGGSVILTGTGPLTTTTTNSLSGSGSFNIGTNSTFIIAGFGQMAAAGYAGNYAEGVTLSGTLTYSSSNSTTLSGAISGSGGKINVSAPFNGELSLTSGSSSYTNSITTITAGILNYSSDASAGAAPGSPITNIFLNGGDLLGSGDFTLNTNRNLGIGLPTGSIGTNALIDSTSGIFTIGGNLLSAGNTGVNGLIINSENGSGGIVALTGTNLITGSITIDGGTLSLTDPGYLNLGSYTGVITNSGATFDYSSSGTQTLSGVMLDGPNGSGMLSLGGNPPASGAPTGTLILTGPNTFSGGITINSGTLLLGGGGLLGAVSAGSGTFTGQIEDSGTLVFNSTGTQTLSGITGGGALIHNGAATLTLTGNNTYSGATTNNAGTVALVGDGQNTGLLRSSSIIDVNAPGILDPTALTLDGSLHVGDISIGESSQTLSGNGSILGSVIVGYSGTLAPGPVSGYGTLSVANNLTVGDANNGGGAIVLGIDHPVTGAASDSVSARSISILVNASSPAPTLTINQGANDLQTGDTFHLFNIAGNTGVSTIKNLALTLPVTGPVSGVTYVWNTNNLAVNGTLVLTHGAAAVNPVNPNPTNMVVSASSGAIHISWPADHTGWNLQSNSVSLNVSSDWFTIPGSSATNQVTIPIGSGKNVFFRMQYQP